eukprot:1157362-Pelagomonas_calceolata.AAC.8
MDYMLYLHTSAEPVCGYRRPFMHKLGKYIDTPCIYPNVQYVHVPPHQLFSPWGKPVSPCTLSRRIHWVWHAPQQQLCWWVQLCFC